MQTDYPVQIHSPYSASKASSDMLVKAYIDTYHFPANVTNTSNNYGPYQFPEKLIPLIINNALHGKKLPVYGDGLNIRDWLYVDDHANGIDMVQEHGKLGESYNIGGHNEKRNIEIINIIIETLQEILPDTDPRKANVSKDLITYVEDRKGHDRRYAIAPDKIKAEIGWEPETMFKDGIKKTIAWYLEHEDWMNNVTSGDYQKYYEDMYQGK
jgi:dTDP-glucose 4,6-dehydratase